MHRGFSRERLPRLPGQHGALARFLEPLVEQAEGGIEFPRGPQGVVDHPVFLGRELIERMHRGLGVQRGAGRDEPGHRREGEAVSGATRRT